MRDILFRGKRADNGEWMYGNLVVYWNKTFIAPRSTTTFNRFEVIPETVGQFTGLKDKNGVKIFEGDIVKVVKGVYDRKPFVVSWYDRSCGFEPYSDSIENCGHCGGGYNPEYTKVIGNIHDNPELSACKIKDMGGWTEWAIEEVE